MQSAWGIVAGFIAVIFALVGVVMLAERLPSTERLAAGETVEGIEVPVIGTVGDFPDPAHRTVVNVTADARVTIDGVAYATYWDLVPELKRRAARTKGELILGTRDKFLSDESFVLRADRAVPWRVCELFFMACSESMIWRIYFDVRHESDGRDGALAMFLPADKGSCDDDGSLVTHRLAAVRGNGKAGPALAYAALQDFPASIKGTLRADLDFDPELSLGDALALIDASIRAGAVSVQFAAGGAPGLADSPAFVSIAARGSNGPGYDLLVDGKPLATDRPSRAVPGVARVRGEVKVPGFGVTARRPPVAEPFSPEAPSIPRTAVPK